MGTEPTSSEITEALNTILQNQIFVSSPKAQEFLRYIVSETLEGRGQDLNGTRIAQDVFGKDGDFDPIQDSVVRVTARRLRYMLQDYYSDESHKTNLIITIPKGGYKPHFDRPAKSGAFQKTIRRETQKLPKTQDSPLKASPLHKSLAKPLIFTIAAAMILAGLFAFIRPFDLKNSEASQKIAIQNGNHIAASYPSIAVIRFKNQTGDTAYDFLEQGLQMQMTEDLSRFELIRPNSYEDNYESLLRTEDVHYDYALTGVILNVEQEIDLYVKLVNLKDSNPVFDDRIRRSPGDNHYYESLYGIVSEISGNVAGLEGVILKERLDNIQSKFSEDTDSLFNLEAFECNGLIGILARTPSPELYKKTYNCHKTLLEADPKNATLLSGLGWLTYIGATSRESILQARSFNPDIDKDEGIAMMEESVRINPANSWAQQALSALKSNNDDIQGALKHAELAVRANPVNPDNLAWLSLCLAHSGQWDRAMSIAQEALDRNPEPSSQYYYTFFMKALHDGDAEAMSNTALKLTQTGNYYAKLYSYLAALAADDRGQIAELEPHVEKMGARYDDGIMHVVKTLIPSETLRTKAKSLLPIKGSASTSL